MVGQIYRCIIHIHLRIDLAREITNANGICSFFLFFVRFSASFFFLGAGKVVHILLYGGFHHSCARKCACNGINKAMVLNYFIWEK